MRMLWLNPLNSLGTTTQVKESKALIYSKAKRRKRNLLKGKEEGTSSHNEEECEIEDALLPGHHDTPIAAKRVSSWQFFPFPNHLLPCYHHRHGCTFTEGRTAEQRPVSPPAAGMSTPSSGIQIQPLKRGEARKPINTGPHVAPRLGGKNCLS